MEAQLSGFFAASLLLALAPGPDNLFVLAQSALYGRRAGLLITLGLCTGLLVHTLLVGLGVAALFASSPAAFLGLKIVGAIYLLYLAWLSLVADEQNEVGSDAPNLNLGQFYRRGIIMNIANPKVSVFFLAFLPQFVIGHDAPVIQQVLMLGGFFIVATLTVFSCIVLLAGAIGELLVRHAGIKQGLDRAAAFVLVAVALTLLFSDSSISQGL